MTEPMTDTESPTEAHESAETPEQDEQTKRVPVTEAIRYRKRAQAAEQSLTETREQFEQIKSRLDEADQTIRHLERRQKIDDMLRDSDTIDIEAARLLTEIAVESMEQPDVREAVEQLRRGKPYLFRRNGHGASAMSARTDEHDAAPAQRAAEQAATTGDRRDLLRYLRLRRSS